MREDEIEALLKFDRAKLVVHDYRGKDLLVGVGQDYVAIITSEDGRNFAGTGKRRLDAIYEAWKTYQRFMVAPLSERYNHDWLLKNAEADVEVQLNKNLQEKQSWQKSS
jgi:uncharacterized protein YifN (PemK superfamily)